MNHSALLLALLSLGLFGLVKCNINTTHTITFPEDLIQFSDDVNNGTSYEGMTVLLDSDLDFADGNLSELFNPIGMSLEFSFNGVFDGQGHIIKNLVVESSSSYVGLFGYSSGASIMNVILDKTCSFAKVQPVVITSGSSSLLSSEGEEGEKEGKEGKEEENELFMGSIIGFCNSINRSCIIKNNINMATISYIENASSMGPATIIGGIVAVLDSENFETIVRNCINYGNIEYDAMCEETLIGGILGSCDGSSDSGRTCNVQNNINYGTITHGGRSGKEDSIGGIAGSVDDGTIANCVNMGQIPVNSTTYHVGSIAGMLETSTGGNNYWCNNAGQAAFGFLDAPSTGVAISFDEFSLELNQSITVGNYTGTSLIKALNAEADLNSLREYSHWLLNVDFNNITFTFNNEEVLAFDSQVILLPNLANDGTLFFDGWYTDNTQATPLTNFEIAEDTDLFATWGENIKNYTITFDTRTGTPIEPITGQFGTVVDLPSNSVRPNCSIVLWRNDYGDAVEWNFTIPAQDITLHAMWFCTAISSPEDLIELAKTINLGVVFEPMTVVLESDINFTEELSREFEPIGISEGCSLSGVFDGQGHTIRGLHLRSSLEYVGVFGYSLGLTVRNLILDSSCVIVSECPLKKGFVGGILGGCEGEKDICVIENCLNFGEVKFNGTMEGKKRVIHMGGIAGYLGSADMANNTVVLNCVNFGNVVHAGNNTKTYIGGVVGFCTGEGNMCDVLNCANYGLINITGATDAAATYIGGVVGYGEVSYIENCVSGGIIAHNITGGFVGGIAGSLVDSTLSNSIWTFDTNCNVSCNGEEAAPVTLDVYNVDINATHQDLLNENVLVNEGWLEWVILYLEGGRIAGSNGSDVLVLHKVFPDAVKDKHTFEGWYLDLGLNVSYDPMSVNFSDVSEIYAVYEPFTFVVSFDFGNGTVVEYSGYENASIVYPDAPSKEGYVFVGWCDANESMCSPTGVPGENITLHLVYEPVVIPVVPSSSSSESSSISSSSSVTSDSSSSDTSSSSSMISSSSSSSMISSSSSLSSSSSMTSSSSSISESSSSSSISESSSSSSSSSSSIPIPPPPPPMPASSSSSSSITSSSSIPITSSSSSSSSSIPIPPPPPPPISTPSSSSSISSVSSVDSSSSSSSSDSSSKTSEFSSSHKEHGGKSKSGKTTAIAVGASVGILFVVVVFVCVASFVAYKKKHSGSDASESLSLIEESSDAAN